jgi:hypothetical protein
VSVRFVPIRPAETDQIESPHHDEEQERSRPANQNRKRHATLFLFRFSGFPPIRLWFLAILLYLFADGFPPPSGCFA